MYFGVCSVTAHQLSCTLRPVKSSWKRRVSPAKPGSSYKTVTYRRENAGALLAAPIKNQPRKRSKNTKYLLRGHPFGKKGVSSRSFPKTVELLREITLKHRDNLELGRGWYRQLVCLYCEATRGNLQRLAKRTQKHI